MRPDRLAIEIGGTKLQVALGDATGRIARRRRAQVASGSDAVAILEQVDALIDGLLASEQPASHAVRSAAIGFGGPVETATGRALLSHHVPGWEDCRLRDRFESSLRVPVSVYNDANAAGWGEYVCGTGAKTQTFCYMNVGSGIGGALVLGGALHDGQGLGAFEIGHTRYPEPTTQSETLPPILETHCSGWSIERDARQSIDLTGDTPLARHTGGDPERLTCQVLGEAAREGDTEAFEVLDGAARRLGLAIANTVTLLSPEVFAIGGGVSLLGDVLFDPLRAYVKAYAFAPYRESVRVVPAALGEDVVLAGALLLAPEV